MGYDQDSLHNLAWAGLLWAFLMLMIAYHPSWDLSGSLQWLNMTLNKREISLQMKETTNSHFTVDAMSKSAVHIFRWISKAPPTAAMNMLLLDPHVISTIRKCARPTLNPWVSCRPCRRSNHWAAEKHDLVLKMYAYRRMVFQKKQCTW